METQLKRLTEHQQPVVHHIC